MIPLTSLTSLSGAPPRMTSLRTCMQQPRGHPAHTNDVSASYGRSNGYRELNSVHPHGHHQERLPSDLDNMSIERLECDMESVLHDTLMDDGALDFNFDPTAGPHGFPQRVKTTTHSWVSG
ncbi:forkhead box protein O1-A-like [Lates japonicus]